MAILTNSSRVCRWIWIGFAIAYGAALALALVGLFGLFGSERDPIAAVFLIPLGLPWNRVLDFASLTDMGRVWLALLAPLINLVIIYGVCRMTRR